MSLISVNNLAAGYGNVPVAENINFKVDKGDYLCIIGENGAGKSTIIKTLLGLIPPVSGEILIGDGKRIGYLPQQTTLQKDFPASVMEIVMTGLLPGKKGLFFNKKDREKAEEKLRLLGIEDLKKKNFRYLSGGQQQKVLIARALCISADILLLDEPVTGLDPMATEDLYKVISDIHDKGTAIVMISHDRDAALVNATHVLYLTKKDFFYGTKEEFMGTKYCDFVGRAS